MTVLERSLSMCSWARNSRRLGVSLRHLEESGVDEVKGLGSLAGSLACVCWVEVREIETSNNCPESWVMGDVREEFGCTRCRGRKIDTT